jgi:hypothetical protein
VKVRNVYGSVVGLTIGLLCLAVPTQAASQLTVIGTATYAGSDYNLIWEHGSEGDQTSLVWLDYTAPAAYWANQMAWAAGLESQLTYNIDPTYGVNWAGAQWRLPSAGDAPSYGMQAATQELGHLYYESLALTGGSSNAGVTAPDLGATIFQNLELTAYWTSTPDDPLFQTGPVWMFAFRETRSAPYYDTIYGFQDIDATSGSFWGISLAMKHEGLAVLSAEVTTATVVPLPAAAWAGMVLMGAMGGVAGIKRKLRRD